MSQYSIYVTDQTRIEIENIDFFGEEQFKIQNKNMYFIFNRLTRVEIKEK